MLVLLVVGGGQLHKLHEHQFCCTCASHPGNANNQGKFANLKLASELHHYDARIGARTWRTDLSNIRMCYSCNCLVSSWLTNWHRQSTRYAGASNSSDVPAAAGCLQTLRNQLTTQVVAEHSAVSVDIAKAWPKTFEGWQLAIHCNPKCKQLFSLSADHVFPHHPVCIK